MNGLDISFLLKKIKSDDAYVIVVGNKVLRKSGFENKSVSDEECNWLKNYMPPERFREYKSEDLYVAGKRLKLHISIEEIGYYFFVFDDGVESDCFYYKVTALVNKVMADPDRYLKMHYQPRFSYQNKGIKLEALLRVQQNNITTGEFIKAIEMEGLGCSLDQWVFNAVIKDVERIRKMGFKGVSINLLPSSISEDIYQLLLGSAKEYRDFIEIELTEYSKLVQEGLYILEKVKKLGFKLALDDFGSGFSNFDYLKKNIFDVVKLDQSWVTLVREDPDKVDLLKHLVSFLRIAKADIVLEGIEFRQDLNIVEEIEPDEVQGYIYSRPESLDEIEKMNLLNMIPIKKLSGDTYAEV